jgi:hypothetical protein
MTSICKYLIFIILTMFGMIHLSAQEPFIRQQEMIMREGKLFSGCADFKFAVVSDHTTLWSNDATSFDASEPISSVRLEVKDGIFSAILGQAPLSPFFYELLKLYSNASLLTWVNTGNGFTLLKEQPIDPGIVQVLDEEENRRRDVVREIPQLVRAEGIKEDPLKPKRKKNPMKPDEAMRQRVMQRADENGQIPMDGLVNGLRHIQNMPQPKDAGLWNWEWLGPGNIGGRIRAIAIHPTNPNTIFVGAVAGGIWKSTNGGSSWAVVNDFLPNLAITTIVYDPTNTSIMYASTGEGFYNHDALPGAGIFKSTNGGTTWSQLASTNNTDFRWVNRLDHHPDSTGILYAATRDPHRIWKTINGGTTWTNIYTSGLPVLDVKVSPHSPYNRIIAGTQGFGTPNWANTGDVFLSNDWGKTWSIETTGAANKLPNNPQRCEVTFCANNANWIYVSIGRSKGEIWRSTDGGSTWSMRSNSYEYLGGQQWYNNCIWVNPNNSDHIIVGGIDLWRSTNGGTTLTRISDWTKYHNNSSANSAHADHHIILQHPNFNNSTNKTVFVGNDGGIQRMTDYSTGTTTSGWTNLCGTTLGITQFFGGAAAPDGSFVIGGTQDNDHLRYKPSGSWSGAGNWYQAETGDGGFAAINPSNTAIQYSEYTDLWIQKSTNSGDSWFDAVTGLSDAGTNALFIAPFVMDPNTPTRLIAGGASIWRTTNSAGNWSSIRAALAATDPPLCSAIDIASGNSDIIWVGYNEGHVARTTNGTAGTPAWTRLDNNPTALPNRYVTDIAINPNNHNQVFVTFGGYEPNNVWFTNDGGSNWVNRSGTAPNNLPSIQVNTVRFHPSNSNWVYIGTDLGAFASEDQGQNWSVDPRYPSQGHEFPANTEISELFWQGNTYLIAATHGRGMYRAQPMTIIYVDKLAAAGGNGTAAAPYQTVTQAVNAAGPGTVISIKSNTYDEPNPLLFYKRGHVKTTNGATLIK